MQTVTESIECVLEFLETIPLSKDTIRHYKSYMYSSVASFCDANGIVNFSDDELQNYTNEQTARANSGEFTLSTMVHRRKAAALLADCMQNRTLIWTHKAFKTGKLPDCLDDVLDDYRNHILSRDTIKAAQTTL